MYSRAIKGLYRTFTVFAFIFLLLIGAGANASAKDSSPSIGKALDFGWRPSILIPKTAVLIIKNKSDSAVKEIKLEYWNQDNGKTRTFSLGTLKSHENTEIGMIENSMSPTCERGFS